MSTEVVTSALVRYVDWPGVAAPIALITLENGHDHTRPSTFGAAGLDSLDAALDQIEAQRPAVAAIAVTGKPFVFAVGADLSGVGSISTREQALAITRRGQQVFARFRSSATPTFAFLNGAALGGGLELALSCHYRTVSDAAGAIAFPECFLGLIPGWGGAWLLPNLIGAEAAISVIIGNPLANNRMLRPAEAAAIGIADTVLPAADFLESSMSWAAAVLAGTRTVTRPDPDRGAAWAGAVATARRQVEARLHGSAPSYTKALNLIESAAVDDIATGYAAQCEALADLLLSDELRAGLYAFDLTQKRARKPAGAPDPALARTVGTVGVVGAGLMASQLTLLFGRRLQVPVVLTDIDAGRLEAALGYVRTETEKLLARHRISELAAARLIGSVTTTTDLGEFGDADFVIEAVFEDLDVKRSVFADLEKVVGEDCVIATNTSSLSVSAMAEGLSRPQRVVGFHFFNPVAVLPLLEVARGACTDDATVATALAVAQRLRKSAVLVADAPGFLVNRLLARVIGEVVAAVDEGTPIDVADTALDPLGLPMRPFVLLALVGPAISLHVAETMHRHFPDRYAVSENLSRIVAAGKTGVYLWDEHGRPSVDPEVAALLRTGNSPSTPAQLHERVCRALADEISIMLTDGVVAAAADVDLGLILGAGWPFHDGGITPYLDRIGMSEAVTGHRFNPPGVASLPR